MSSSLYSSSAAVYRAARLRQSRQVPPGARKFSVSQSLSCPRRKMLMASLLHWNCSLEEYYLCTPFSLLFCPVFIYAGIKSVEKN